MAGFFGTFIVEWQCLNPSKFNEEHGFIEVPAHSENDAVERFINQNPEYKVISIKERTE